MTPDIARAIVAGIVGLLCLAAMAMHKRKDSAQ